MRLILVKLLVLERSLTIAWDVAGDVAVDAARRVAWDTARHATWDAVGNAARDVAKGKTTEEIANVACLSVMCNYNKILSAIDNKGSLIRPDKNADWSKILRRLITFDDEAMKKLGLMNHRFRIFYLFRVHELFSLLEENKQLIADFYKLVQTIGDLECYNELFITNIPLTLIESGANIPRDVAKIILDYSNFSVHNPDDVVLVHNKITGSTNIKK
jgi:hypothetical protein